MIVLKRYNKVVKLNEGQMACRKPQLLLIY